MTPLIGLDVAVVAAPGDRDVLIARARWSLVGSTSTQPASPGSRPRARRATRRRRPGAARPRGGVVQEVAAHVARRRGRARAGRRSPGGRSPGRRPRRVAQHLGDRRGDGRGVGVVREVGVDAVGQVEHRLEQRPTRRERGRRVVGAASSSRRTYGDSKSELVGVEASVERSARHGRARDRLPRRRVRRCRRRATGSTSTSLIAVTVSSSVRLLQREEVHLGCRSSRCAASAPPASGRSRSCVRRGVCRGPARGVRRSSLWHIETGLLVADTWSCA